jgi:hypothetical protein
MNALHVTTGGLRAVGARLNFTASPPPRLSTAVTRKKTLAARDYLTNVIIFFSQNTSSLGTPKLFQLLYLLDFEHFAQTGLSATGIIDRAYEDGPVPDLRNATWITDSLAENHANRAFDSSEFTPRQISIMRAIALTFSDDRPNLADPQIANGAWGTVWNEGHGAGDVIPYATGRADGDPRKESALDTAEEYSRYRV